mmetsp:Transcript_150632/g.288651  ORF Transcript_150632/g.288651 Transcript_150632/m.288651 type:complete len:262 (+) Transcript_150632:43-828(+)
MLRVVALPALLLQQLLRSAIGFQVIGAGIRHTCDGLGEALNILGYTTYDSGEDLPNMHADWMRIMQSADPGGKSPSLKPLYSLAATQVSSGFNAIVSSPAAFYALDLLKKYPKAKVILTMHENKKTWFYTAMKATQNVLHRDMVEAEYHRLKDCPLPPADADLPECVAAYDQHNEAIRSKVPAKQLLTFEPKEGWQPLCDFLGLPVPDVPFPGLEVDKGISAMVLGASAVGVLMLVLLVGALFMTSAATPPPKSLSKKKTK